MVPNDNVNFFDENGWYAWKWIKMDANGGLCVEWLQMDYGGSAVLKKSKIFK